MATILSSLHLFLVLFVSNIPLAFPEDENHFIYNGFRQAKLHLDGFAQTPRNGLLQLTNPATRIMGHAFYQFPIRFKTSSNSTSCASFSTNFVFAIVPRYLDLGGHGIAFAIATSTDFNCAFPGKYLGLFNAFNNSNDTNHILAIKLHTVRDFEFSYPSNNEVGVLVNNISSIESATKMYKAGRDNISLKLIPGNPMNLWLEYDETFKFLNVTLAPTRIRKLEQPLLSKNIDVTEAC